MAGWSAKTTLAAVLIAAVSLFCMGDLVQAAMPSMDSPCSTQLCDGQTGCGTAPAKTIVLPAAAVLDATVSALPTSVATPRHGLEGLPALGHQISPSAPRSPPLS